jgi:hypothetical protein
MAQSGERYKADYDLYLIKLVAMHFLVTITELGFTDTGGLGSSGYHEGQEDIQFRKARLPDLKWYGSLCTQISKTYLRMPDELEFSFLGLDDDDEAAADAIDHQRLVDGRMSLNELRLRIGLPPLPFKEANMPMVQTARGVVFLEGSSDTAPPGVLIEPASESGEEDPAQGGGKSPTQRRPIKSGGGVTKAAEDEIAAYARWLDKRGPEPKRTFRFNHLTEEMAAQSDSGMSFIYGEFAKAGGSGPKASSNPLTSRPSPLSGPGGSETSSWSPYGDQS